MSIKLNKEDGLKLKALGLAENKARRNFLKEESNTKKICDAAFVVYKNANKACLAFEKKLIKKYSQKGA